MNSTFNCNEHEHRELAVSPSKADLTRCNSQQRSLYNSICIRAIHNLTHTYTPLICH